MPRGFQSKDATDRNLESIERATKAAIGAIELRLKAAIGALITLRASLR